MPILHRSNYAQFTNTRKLPLSPSSTNSSSCNDILAKEVICMPTFFGAQNFLWNWDAQIAKKSKLNLNLIRNLPSSDLTSLEFPLLTTVWGTAAQLIRGSSLGTHFPSLEHTIRPHECWWQLRANEGSQAACS